MADCMRCKKRCFVVFVFTTVGELVVLISLVVHWRHVRSELIMVPQQQQRMCVPKETFLNQHSDYGCLDGLQEEFRKQKNVTLCCGESSVLLDMFVSKVTKSRYNSDTNPETAELNLTDLNCYVTEENQPSLRLGGLGDRHPVKVGMSFKVFWKAQEQFKSSQGLTHLPDDGYIYVTRAGLYYISAQLKLTLDCSTDTEQNMDKTFRHYIHQISQDGTGTTLLENGKSMCETSGTDPKLTSFIGAVFKLEEGDRVFVATSHPECLGEDRTNNFVSMHRI